MSKTILLLAGDVELSNCTADGQLLNRDTNSDDYVSITSSGNSNNYVTLKDFDFSKIPSNAVISQAVARVKIAASNSDTISGMGFMVRYNAQSYGPTNYSYYKTPRIITYGFLSNIEKVDPSVFYVRFAATTLDTVKFYGADVLIEYDLPVNKVVYGTTVLVDLTADTVTPETLLQGYTAHDKSGALITGANTGGGSTPTLQAKTATPTESQQTVSPDSGYDGLSSVTVEAISSTYVGSGITRRSSSDLTRNAYTITAPAGYYAENASKKVERIPHATPTISLNSSTGAVTAVHSQEQGWVEGSGSGPDATSATLQLDTQAAATITPSTTAQTAVAAGKYTTGAVTVAAMPSGTAGTPTATKGTVSNHSVSVTPSVTNTAGYINGGTKTGTAITVSASELVSGSETKTANGTYNVTNLVSLVVDIPFVTYHTSTSEPTSSQGSNGDIWLVTE